MGVPQTSHTGAAGSPGAVRPCGASGAADTVGPGGGALDGAGAGDRAGDAPGSGVGPAAGEGVGDAAGGCNVAPSPRVSSGLRSASDRSVMARSP